MRHDELDAFLPNQIRLSRRWLTKKMDQIASLRVIPPAQKIDFDSGAFQRLFGLLDLNLKTPMRQKKWIQMIEKHAHCKTAD